LAGHAAPRDREQEKYMKIRLLTALLPLLLLAASVHGDTNHQPFVLASVNAASLEDQVDATRSALESAGFSLAGQYSPLDNATVIVATHPLLLEAAAGTERGGYAAGQRISVTHRDGSTEVAFVNPLYIQYAYRLEADLQPVLDLLGEALGNTESFGAEKNMTAKKLRKYNYMPMMQKFDDPSELASFGSHEQALNAVEEGLAREGDALTKVYRIDIPGTEQVVFGMGMRATNEDEKDIDEKHQMSIVDFEGYSKIAYFPYELLVSGRNAEALHMRFRMAVHFPDLSMMGQHGFTKLMSSPGATEDALENLVKAE
jgi:hypothetical protein